MRLTRSLPNVLIAASVAVLVGIPIAATKTLTITVASAAAATGDPKSPSPEAKTKAAVDAFAAVVRPLSHAKALENAFRGYYSYQAAYPDVVKKPYLYFVDYGLPSTEKRGYVFDMNALIVVDGPFTVAHGRGSATSPDGVPTQFSNAYNSAATSLGLYVAQELYDFHGKSGGRPYSAVGVRLSGVSDGYNDNARGRRVVAHGAPYVTESTAGKSEGCPALEPSRAKRLLPKLADGGMVFLFAPNENWMANDPWVTSGVAN